MGLGVLSIPMVSTDQKFCKSGGSRWSLVITAVIHKRADAVDSEIAFGSGPDSRYPSLDC